MQDFWKLTITHRPHFSLERQCRSLMFLDELAPSLPLELSPWSFKVDPTSLGQTVIS